MKKENKLFLEELLKVATPSGFENEGVELVSDFVKSQIPQAKEGFIDKFNNAAFWVGSNKPDALKVMLSGHIDSISMMVTDITDEGYIKFASAGGIDRKVLLGSRVTVISEDNRYYTGIIGKTPIHIEYDSENYKKVDKIENMYIDLGVESKQDILDMEINVGSLIVYERDREILEFGKKKDLVCAADLDDKSCIYTTFEILKRIDYRELEKKNIQVWGVACANEEQGIRGAKVAARRINPDISIDMDVTFDTEVDINHSKYCDVKVGKGVVIEYGGDRSRRMNKQFIDICKKENIPYQLSTTRPGGTNTCSIQEHAFNCETAHLALPLKNMHTPQEIVSWGDMENMIELVVKYINQL